MSEADYKFESQPSKEDISKLYKLIELKEKIEGTEEFSCQGYENLKNHIPRLEKEIEKEKNRIKTLFPQWQYHLQKRQEIDNLVERKIKEKLGINLVKSDYIQIPGQDFVIAIEETDFYLKYEEAHRAVLKRGLNLPTPLQFMIFHNYIIDAKKNNKPIFDANGDRVSDEIKKNLRLQLTYSIGPVKLSYTWLNGKFNISNEKKSIEYITGLDSQGNFITKTEDLENCLRENAYIDFKKLTRQGLPSIDSRCSNQVFVRGENIYFVSPFAFTFRDRVEPKTTVAQFYAIGEDHSVLDCQQRTYWVSEHNGVRTIQQNIYEDIGGVEKDTTNKKN
jgi:hypothetical protein